MSTETNPGHVEALNIIFDGPPSHTSGRFVEVETDDGRGISAGRWIEREDGLWALRIDLAEVRRAAAKETAERIAEAIEVEQAKWEPRVPVPEDWDLADILRRAGIEAGLRRAARIARAEADRG